MKLLLRGLHRLAHASHQVVRKAKHLGQSSSPGECVNLFTHSVHSWFQTPWPDEKEQAPALHSATGSELDWAYQHRASSLDKSQKLRL